MKTRINKFANSTLKKFGVMMLLGVLVAGCVEDIGDSYTTFKGDMIYSYLEKPETYNRICCFN